MLKRITEVWRTRKNELKEQSADTMQQLSEATQPQGTTLPGLVPFLYFGPKDVLSFSLSGLTIMLISKPPVSEIAARGRQEPLS